jgi:hypothetical protein
MFIPSADSSICLCNKNIDKEEVLSKIENINHTMNYVTISHQKLLLKLSNIEEKLNVITKYFQALMTGTVLVIILQLSSILKNLIESNNRAKIEQQKMEYQSFQRSSGVEINPIYISSLQSSDEGVHLLSH